MRRWGYGGGGSTGAHHKSMGSYERHAGNDAMSIASFLDSNYTAVEARSMYERVSLEDVRKYEHEAEDQIADFIKRSESQRPAVIRKLPDDVTRVVFLTLAIIGCLRARDLMDIRDRYRELLAPGRGNRQTTSGLYLFASEVRDLFDYSWPSEVFDAMDIQDWSDEDDDDDDDDADGVLDEEGSEPASAAAASIPQQSDALKPTLPPPPPQAEPVRFTEVVVAMGSSETVKARPDGDQRAWQLEMVQEEAQIVVMHLRPERMATDALVRTFVDAASKNWGEKPAMLLFAESQRALVEAINTEAQRDAAGTFKRGVARMSFMRWPEELLRALRRELDLVGEPMPAAAELMTSIGGKPSSMLVTPFGCEKEDWRGHRRKLEEWCKRILTARGRWKGAVEVPPLRPANAVSIARDLGKAKRDVGKLEHQGRTPLGEAFYMITSTLLAWRAGAMTTAAASRAAAQAYVRYLFEGDLSRSYYLDVDLDLLFGSGSAEMDLMQAGLLRLLGAPFQTGVSPLAFDSTKPVSLYEVEQAGARRGWFGAWWAVVHVPSGTDAAQATWMPSEAALNKAIRSSAMLDGAQLSVCPTLTPLERDEASMAQSWVDCELKAASHLTKALVGWILSPHGPFKPQFTSQPSARCSRWGFLVLARAENESAIVKARATWPETAARTADSRMFEQDARRGKTTVPRGVAILGETADLLQPDIEVNERLALMAGKMWDADTRRSCF